MTIIQLYKVVDYKAGHCIVDYYKNVYDISPVQLQIGRYRFNDWIRGKLDKSELEGDKVKLWEIRANAKDKPRKNTPPFTITNKEKEIMDYVVDIVHKNTYAIEKDIEIDGCSNALVHRTIRNKNILDLYKLKRVRANKEIKEKLRIDVKGYPFLIVKTR